MIIVAILGKLTPTEGQPVRSGSPFLTIPMDPSAASDGIGGGESTDASGTRFAFGSGRINDTIFYDRSTGERTTQELIAYSASQQLSGNGSVFLYAGLARGDIRIVQFDLDSHEMIAGPEVNLLLFRSDRSGSRVAYLTRPSGREVAALDGESVIGEWSCGAVADEGVWEGILKGIAPKSP